MSADKTRAQLIEENDRWADYCASRESLITAACERLTKSDWVVSSEILRLLGQEEPPTGTQPAGHCRLFHAWGPWSSPRSGGIYSMVERWCKRCGARDMDIC